MLTRRAVVYSALEAVYGTDPAMTTSNAFLVWDLNPDFKGDVLDRDILRDTISPIPHAMGLQDATLSFKTELKGVGIGTTGTNPETNLWAGCGFGTAAVVGTTNVYSLVSAEAAMNSLSFYVFKDGNQHKVTGARGTAKVNMEAGKYGVIDWTFSGKYNAVLANTLPSIATAGNIPPVIYGASFQIGGFSPVCSKAEIDIANDIARREDVNTAAGVNAFRITGRKPKLSFNADAVVESSNPFWGDWSGAVVDTYSILVGSTVGNRVLINGYFQYDSNKYGDDNGISIYECNASLVTSNAATSNQEVTITYQ